MTISVCMGIYNGEKYIEKQLDSIFRQTRKADEVILCDDCSMDGTVVCRKAGDCIVIRRTGDIRGISMM